MRLTGTAKRAKEMGKAIVKDFELTTGVKLKKNASDYLAILITKALFDWYLIGKG